MRLAKIEKYSPRILTTVCVTLLLLGVSASVWAQAQNWWVLPTTGAVERGKIEEITTKKKVYVNVIFDKSPGQITNAAEQADIRKNVTDTFKSHKELTIVNTPATAEFAVIVRTTDSVTSGETERPANFSVAQDPDAEVSVDVTVLVPGAKLPDGTFKSRSVWQTSSQNVQMEAGPGTRFVVNGFLWELKKLREAKAK